MTIAAGTNRVSYTGTGANTVLPVTFKYFEANDLQVQKRVSLTGVITVLVSGVHYTASTPTDPPGTGTVTPIAGVTDFPSSVTWTIVRTTDRSQLTDYVENDAFPAETHEQALDRLTMIAQEVDAAAFRSLRFPDSDDSSLDATLPPSVQRASGFLAFDSDGLPIVAAGSPGAIPISNFALTLVDDLSAEDARITLDCQEDVISVRGDVIRGSSLAVAERLAKGTDGQYLKSGTLDVAWATPASTEVARTPTAAVPGATVEAALAALAMASSLTNMSGAQDNVADGVETAVTGLGNVTIPGTPNGAKVYKVAGQVTVKTGNDPVSCILNVRVGTNGTVADTLISTRRTPPGGGTVIVPYTVEIPPIRFVPATSAKVTISVTITGNSTNDLDSDAVDTFLVIEQISNA